MIPLLAVASPFILFWQAGALFFIADRAARHVSAQKARGRLSRGQERLRTARQGGKNLIRGVRDEPAVKSDGQYVLNSGDSRAHASGQRLNTTGSRLREAITEEGGSSGDGDSGGGSGGSTANSNSNSSPGGGASSDGGSKEFDRDDAIRDPQPPTRNQNRESADDPPRYIQ